MRKSKSLSIIMAMTLAAQGGGAPAVHAMKGQIQDHFLKTVFFRPDLIAKLRPFLSKDLSEIPRYYRIPKFLKLLKESGCKVPKLPITFRLESKDQKRIKEIIEKDDLEFLQSLYDDDCGKIKVVDGFFENESIEIPLLHYCVMKKAIKCFKFLVLNGADPSEKLEKAYALQNFYSDWDCMSIAVCLGEWEMMKILEERGINKFSNPSVWEAAALTHRNNLLKSLVFNKDAISNFEECINVSMHGAARGNNLKGLKILIREGADINAKDKRGKNPLHIAAKNGNKQVVEQLIIKGADINVRDNNGYTPLHIAAEDGQEQVAELLISKGADINAKENCCKGTPLHCAVIYGRGELARLLISKGADINAKDICGQIPLHYAVDFGLKQLAERLISKGADINAKGERGRTPLHRSVLYGRGEISGLLISKGAEINARDNDGYTPLHYATENGQNQVAELLISKGADINAKDICGQIPLHCAVDFGLKQLAELLISKRADLNARMFGETLLQVAESYERKQVAELLKSKGEEINSKDNNYGLSPLAKDALDNLKKLLVSNEKDILHCAAKCGLVNLVEFAVLKGADINAKNARGETPLHCAAENGQTNAVELLISKGADINAKDKYGCTPLHVAVEKGQNQVAELLISKGAQ